LTITKNDSFGVTRSPLGKKTYAMSVSMTKMAVKNDYRFVKVF